MSHQLNIDDEALKDYCKEEISTSKENSQHHAACIQKLKEEYADRVLCYNLRSIVTTMVMAHYQSQGLMKDVESKIREFDASGCGGLDGEEDNFEGFLPEPKRPQFDPFPISWKPILPTTGAMHKSVEATTTDNFLRKKDKTYEGISRSYTPVPSPPHGSGEEEGEEDEGEEDDTPVPSPPDADADNEGGGQRV